jgi:hypothetical protein
MAQKYYPFPAKSCPNTFILLKKILIFMAHLTADDHLISDLLPADLFPLRFRAIARRFSNLLKLLYVRFILTKGKKLFCYSELVTRGVVQQSPGLYSGQHPARRCVVVRSHDPGNVYGVGFCIG